MTTEVHGLAAFYGSPGGELAARLVRERLATLWPSLPGMSVLGIGYAAPYLGLWQREAARCVALTPEHGTLTGWPGIWTQRGGLSSSVVAEEGTLPFADRAFDRLLLVHGLEAAENVRRMLREAWRVLRDDGRLIVVVPNRVGMWAHLDRTPFGHGQPYSAGQLTRLLARHLFRVERQQTALFLPPYGLRFLRVAAQPSEWVGRLLFQRFAGVVIVEAEKDLFAALPAGAVAVRRRIVVTEAA